jgi:hypothetical protein
MTFISKSLNIVMTSSKMKYTYESLFLTLILIRNLKVLNSDYRAIATQF